MEQLLAPKLRELQTVKGLVVPEFVDGFLCDDDMRNLDLLREDLVRFYTYRQTLRADARVFPLNRAPLSMVVSKNPPYRLGPKEVAFGVFNNQTVGHAPYLYGRLHGFVGSINRALEEIKAYCVQPIIINP